MLAEWLGGEHDGLQVEVKFPTVLVVIPEFEPLTSIDDPISPVELSYREVLVPVKLWSDGSYKIVWADRHPR